MKMDVTVSSKNHINIGDFSSIEPSIQITVKDVEPHKYNQVYENVKQLVETTTALQGLSDIEEMFNMVNVREDVREYFRQIYEQKEKIEESRMEAYQRLEKI